MAPNPSPAPQFPTRTPLAPRHTLLPRCQTKSQPKINLKTSPTCECPGCPTADFENLCSASSYSTFSLDPLSLNVSGQADHDTTSRPTYSQALAQSRIEGASQRAAALALEARRAKQSRDEAEAAARAHLASLAAVVRAKTALEAELAAERARSADARAAARSVSRASGAEIAGLRGEVAAAVDTYEAEHAAMSAENAEMRAFIARLTTLAERDQGRSRARPFNLRRKHALEDEMSPSVTDALFARERERMAAKLSITKSERDAARARVRALEESEGLRALEAVGEVAGAVRSRLSACHACRRAVLDAVAEGESEVRRKYERGVVR
ncbi:unnamed protein product [Cutaneotrichosporon oleaginosum]